MNAERDVTVHAGDTEPSVPRAFALNLDPGANDQQVRRPLGAAIWDIHSKGLLPLGQSAEVWHHTGQAD